MNNYQINDEEAEVYDRQIRLWGVEAQKRMRTSKVLVCGNLNGLACEIAKNLALSGVNVVVQDVKSVEAKDLGSNFFYSEDMIDKNRAEESMKALKDLNPLVDLSFEKELNVIEYLKKNVKSFSLVVFVDGEDFTFKDTEECNDICKLAGVKFIATGCAGLDGYLFNDFGNHSYVISRKEEEKDDDNAVQSKENKNKKVRVEKKKTNFQLTFPSLKETFSKVSFKDLEKSKRKRVADLYYALLIERVVAENKDELTNDEIKSLLNNELKKDSMTIENLKTSSEVELIDTVKNFITLRQKKAMVSPICAILGGIVAQEVLKGVQLIDHPIVNFFFFDGTGGKIHKIGA